jgi:hypothetical protein
MLRKIIFIFLFQFLCVFNLFGELRTFREIFPNLNDDVKKTASGNSGYIKYSSRAEGINLICGHGNGAGIDQAIVNTILAIEPGYIVESITLLTAAPGSVTLLDIYNALGNIQDLKGRLYPSETKKQEVPLFEDAVRIVSEKKSTPVSDPPPAALLPRNEVIYLRLKDANFGNSYYRAEMNIIQYGLSYTMSNFRNLSYFLIPVIKEGKFRAQMYFEPIQEGILIYSIAGMEINEFFASKIHIHSAIAKRLNVIVFWAADGIRKK